MSKPLATVSPISGAPIPFIVSEKKRPGELVHPLQRFAHLEPLAAARMEISFWKIEGAVQYQGNPRFKTLEEASSIQSEARANARKMSLAQGRVWDEPATAAPQLNQSFNGLRGPASSAVMIEDEAFAWKEKIKQSVHQVTIEEMSGMGHSNLEKIKAMMAFTSGPGEPKQTPIGEPEQEENEEDESGESKPENPDEYIKRDEFAKHEKLNSDNFKLTKDGLDMVGEAISLMVPRIKKLEDERVTPQPVVVHFGDKAALPPHEAGLQHFLFPVFLTIVQASVNAYLPGPAGAGKTRGCREVAKALGLDFRLVSVCEETSASALMGYMDAQGRYVRSALRECFEHGGVFLLDEMDAGNANTLTVINAITSTEVGETASFPDGMVVRHPNFRFVAAGNTFGTGASFHYVGRNRLDAATLDRMAYLAWPVDPSLEAMLIGVVKPRKNPVLDFGGIPTPEQWLARVDVCRATANANDMKLILSPRCVLMGCRLAAAGLGMAWLTELLIFKDMPESSQEILMGAIEAANA